MRGGVSRRRAAVGLWLAVASLASTSATGQAPGLRIVEIHADAGRGVPRFGKLEISFLVTGSVATVMQWPFDSAPPPGIPAAAGITVNGVFVDPDGRSWIQPAFYAEEFVDGVRDGRDWHLPTGRFTWRLRFAPHRTGTWAYKIVATDRGGTSETPLTSFDVVNSDTKGFVRVSRSDTRYFEFDDGTPFNGTGFQLPDYLGNPATAGQAAYERLAENGVSLVRVAISAVYGSAWSNWVGGRNRYRGYLPVTGLVPAPDVESGGTALAMQLQYGPGGDTGWFDACRMQFWEDQAESIKPFASYRIRVRYRGQGIAGPRQPGRGEYGLVAKLSDGWHANCHEPGTGTAVTSYGIETAGSGVIEGRWYSGGRHFLPRMYLALENVTRGTAQVFSVSLMEDLGGGAFGPELMIKPSMQHQLYVPEEKAHALDKVVGHAERNGVYLKLVVMDVNDKIYYKMADDGGWATTDNPDGFYGVGRGRNKTRWLQQMWWRYLQARWGYSPSIHSWELANEGDPALEAHYQLADEFGKFMHCRVFGLDPGPGDAAPCALRHPNSHMVTTSLWSGLPVREFWGSPKYPNVDYADLHAYVSTSFAPRAERERMAFDAAYYHLWHSRYASQARVGKPVVRGEAGLDAPERQSESAIGLHRDSAGLWLHNFLWSMLDSGGLHEIYWWREHIWLNRMDIIREYRAYSRFVRDLPLNRGGYTDWAGTVSNPGLRVVGQKNLAAAAMHLWVQNAASTWKNAADGIAVAPVSGRITVPGFVPGRSHRLERWDVHTPGGRVMSVERLVADAHGDLAIEVPMLLSDVAYLVRGPWPEGDDAAHAWPQDPRARTLDARPGACGTSRFGRVGLAAPAGL